MLKRELKINLKSFIIWLGIFIFLFLIVFLIYPSIIDSEQIGQINEFIKMFPEEVLKAFNMDISTLDSAYGWLKSEGFVFILLISGCYASILGSNILLKEENDKTIEYLIMLPMTRKKIVIQKVLVGVFYITMFVLGIGIFNWIGLSLSGNFDEIQYFHLSITPLLSSLVIFFICLFLSTFTHKTKKMIGISLGIVLLSYVLQMFSTLAEPTEFLKYFSVFTLADIRNVITNHTINLWMVGITILLSVFFFVMTLIRYQKKDLI